MDEQYEFYSVSDRSLVEAGATAMQEVMGYSIHREHDVGARLRLYSGKNEISPINPALDLVGLASCLEIALNNTTQHRIWSYRVGNQPTVLVFQSREDYPYPPQTRTIPHNSDYPVLW